LNAPVPKKSSLKAENLVFLPWWLNAALAVASFLLLSRIPPLAMVLLFFFAAMAALSALRAILNAQMLERQTGIDSLRKLPWKQFENLLGEAYRRQGFKVTETLSGGADGGVDLKLQRNGETVVVQCKRWNRRRVPVEIVRELYGVMIHNGATAAKLVATTNFTHEAIDFAGGKPIELVDSKLLVRLLRDVQTSGKMADALLTEPTTSECPLCGSPMVLRTARRGPNAGQGFWGCSRYPNCRGTQPV
jgi:restriction system protein